jgi:hypothetical protein
MKTNQMIKTLLILVAFFCGGMAVSAAETPSQADVTKALQKQFTNTEYATRQYELTVDSVQCGTPRQGDYRTDGTPANTKTQVIPSKVIWTRVTTYTAGDAHVLKEQFTGEYVFFLDEFGEWTFKIKKQESKTL